MRTFKNIKIEKYNKKGLLIGVAMLTLLVGCGKTNTTETNVPADTEKSATSENTTATNKDTEKVTEKITEATEVPAKDGLDVNDDASIEATVDMIYAKNPEFYDQNGMSKDDIRYMIFVINDKYTDEENKPVMNQDEMARGFDGINVALYSDGLIQKMDNVNTVDYDVDKFELIKQPTLVDYIDLNLAGGKLLAEEVAEYEELRDYEVDYMNKEGKIDVDTINKSVIENEVTAINNNSRPMTSVRGNGQLYLMASTHVYRLNMAAVANNYDSIYLTAPEYDGINTVKINYTAGERDVIGAVERLILDGLLSEETYNNVVTFIKKELDQNKTDKEIIQAVAAEYDLEVKYDSLILADVKARMSMASTSYLDVTCNAYARTNQAVSSLNSSNTLTLTPSTEN